MISVAVMAHNEEESILRALGSVLAQAGFGPEDRIVVLENGSTDRTVERVEAFARDEPRVALRRIDRPDKANAWNAYVRAETETGSGAGPAADRADALHVFMDGDVEMRPGALAALVQAAAENPDALAVSAVPHGGRTAPAWRARLLANHGLAGNLYALPDSTLRRIRAEEWLLPYGLIGDDTFLLWILKRRLDPLGAPDMGAIVPSAAAGFAYESIPRDTLAGLWSLYRRQRTYALRDLQLKLLIDHLRAAPGRRPPERIRDLYPAARPWTLLFGPYGRLRPLAPRKGLFLSAWWRTRS